MEVHLRKSMPTMGFGFVGDVHVCVHLATPPSEEDWKQYIDVGSEYLKYMNRGVVITEGGAPSASQRAHQNDRVAEVIGQLRVPMSIVTPSTMVRAVATAVAFFTKQQFRVYAPSDYEAALDNIGLDGPERSQVRSELAALRIALKLPPTPGG